MNLLHKYTSITLFTLPLFFHVLLRPASSKYILSNCPGANFTANSSYQTNLNLLFSNLLYNSNNTIFFNSTIGVTPNKVYGLYMCRGDTHSQACHDCVQEAISDSIKYCPTRVEAVVWCVLCTLRYANRSIFGVADTSVWLPQGQPSGTGTASIYAADFGVKLRSLMLSLIEVAAYDASARRFAANKTEISRYATLYGYVQCTPDISDDKECKGNLLGAYKHFAECCNDSFWGSLFTPSCNVPFSVDPILDDSAMALTIPMNRTSRGGDFIEQSCRRKPLSVIIVYVAIGEAIIILFGCCFVLQKIWASKKSQPVQRGEIGADQVLRYDFATLQAATGNFSIKNKLGQGGFGVVYKGVLLDGQEIAVKRLSRNSSAQAIEVLKAEASVVGQLQHRNLVKLLGFCSEEELLLVYEFLPNRSLDQFLFDAAKRVILDWGTRHNIIVGIARGLLYLHEDSRQKIIHRDLKSSNILLDQDMNPKIADFGIAKTVGTMQTHWDTSKIVGTWGYMAPEYAASGQFSVKSDVFSFGVIVLEIVSGQRSFYPSEEAPYHLLHLHAWKLWNEGASLDMMDRAFIGSWAESEILRCIHIALLCVQGDPATRPSMASVFHMLLSALEALPSPSQPAPVVPRYNRSHSAPKAQSQLPNNPSYQQFTDMEPR